jgi:hypothetical protein
MQDEPEGGRRSASLMWCAAARACTRSSAPHHVRAVSFADAPAHPPDHCARFRSGDRRLLIALAVNNGYFAGRVSGNDVWPVTYLMLQRSKARRPVFLIVAAMYAAELIWRERDTHFDGIHDALPIGEGTDWLSKLTAIAVVEACCSR